MTTTATFAVLDDNTRDANVIGHASTPEQAAQVYSDNMRAGMDADDFAEMTIPTFAWRNPHNADFRDVSADAIADGYFEPLL